MLKLDHVSEANARCRKRDTQQEVCTLFILFSNVNCIFRWTVYWQSVFHSIALQWQIQKYSLKPDYLWARNLFVWVRNQFIHLLEIFFGAYTLVTHFWMNFMLAKRTNDVSNTVSIYIFTYTLKCYIYTEYGSGWDIWVIFEQPNSGTGSQHRASCGLNYPIENLKSLVN